MSFRAGAHIGQAGRTLRALLTGAKRFCSDRRGIAAVEFALIAPLLLAMYFVTMEVAQAIETNKKVNRLSSMVADLVAQQLDVSTNDLKAIMKIGDTTLQPYGRTDPKIVITAIQMTNDATPKAKVAWSWKVQNGAYSKDVAKNTETTVPANLNIANTFLIRVQTELDYRPVLTWAADGKKAAGLTAAFDKLPMEETYYLRPRVTNTITCSDCP
ncbi:hypothetical protein ASD44_00995 [Mesorhizobium sp. Root554]|uniref:TadE/TadG family type IV pilus assembly protein n=1 Tax=unclassified Mesorhizobium TaxID=325217 RepID=UPI0006F6F6DD|nr:MULTISPECIES: TadE/TadG family type IV pilus assembly protein [unclassified Mesorhizobium]KQZ12797.1 hypothetical protein ASD27_00995 [Mesorhizobium sp. Root1471]KQZ35318.1 hypothetical protein ASD44_00995 [Mesorhizobium sp. Root554]